MSELVIVRAEDTRSLVEEMERIAQRFRDAGLKVQVNA